MIYQLINNYSNDTCKLVYETEKDKDGNKIKPAEQQTPNIMENAGKTLTEYFAENGVFHNKVGQKKDGPRETHWQDKTAPEQHAAMHWAQRLKRVSNINAEVCEHCGGAVKVIACIEESFPLLKVDTSF